MYTSMLLLLTAGFAGEVPASTWQTYEQVSQRVEKENKPMAVFLGSGPKGWEGVAGPLGSDAEKLLTSRYLCVYVDISTPTGKKLADAFELKKGVGVVLSDRKGVNQAYWHDGSLPQAELVQQLTRHSLNLRVSAYPADEAVKSTTMFLQTGSSYCPSCNSGRRR